MPSACDSGWAGLPRRKWHPADDWFVAEGLAKSRRRGHECDRPAYDSRMVATGETNHATRLDLDDGPPVKGITRAIAVALPELGRQEQREVASVD